MEKLKPIAVASKPPSRTVAAQSVAAVAQSSFVHLQSALGNQAMQQLLESGRVQTKLRVSQPGDADEQEADRVAEQIVSRPSRGSGPVLQRKCACGGTCSSCKNEDEDAIHRSAIGPLRAFPFSIQRAVAEDPTHSSGSAAEAARHDTRKHPGEHPHTVVVEDDAPSLSPGQMRKTQFVALLQTTTCATADAVLESVGHTTKGCPYIKKWLAHYKDKDAQHLSRAIHKYAPETLRARSAHEAIALVNHRVQRAALSWAKTGKVSDLPEGLQEEMGGGGFLGAVASFASSGFGGALLGFLGGGKKETPARGDKVQRKSRDGAEAGGHDAAAVKSQLGSGHSLDGRIQSKMSAAFGYNFSSVRVHTDSKAGELSSQLNARAFTIGSDVAFAGSEYKPGTLVGDALIAHELAHVVQQNGGKQNGAQMKDSARGDDSQLEQDADRSAVGAVVSAWSGVKKGLATIGPNALPRLKSGLRLSRCSKADEKNKDAGMAKDGAVDDAPVADAGQKQARNFSGLTVSDEDKKRIEASGNLTRPIGPIAPFSEGPRFVLHDTAAVESTARLREHEKGERGPLDEAAAAWIPASGSAVIARPDFFDSRRPTATGYEKRADIISQSAREAAFQRIWASTNDKERNQALNDVLASLALSPKAKESAKDELLRAISERKMTRTEVQEEQTKATKELTDPLPAGGKPHIFTTASWVIGAICARTAAAGAKAVANSKANEKILSDNCTKLNQYFALRDPRVGSSVNVEIVKEAGSDCKTGPAKDLKPLPPYTSDQYQSIAATYMRAALQAGIFPEITTHFWIDRIAGDHCDPRCFRLSDLYTIIATRMLHPVGSTYGIAPNYGTTQGTNNVFWIDKVCGKPHP